MPRSNITLYDWCMKHDKSLLDRLEDVSVAHTISYASHQKIKWVCSRGHIFDSEPYNFTTQGRAKFGFRCKVCNGVAQKGVNDLGTTYPELALEWADDLNELSSSDVTAGSFYKVWWRCKYGHT